jgi:hypothetical protein
MASPAGKGIVLRIGTEYSDRDIKRAMADLGKLQSQVNGPAAAMTKFGTSLQDAGRKIGGFGRSLTTALTLPLVAAGAGAFAMIQKASDLQETISKTNVVFDSAASSILDWSKTSATALGQSQTQALNAASTFAIFGKSAGLSGGALVDFSTTLVGLATDLASFSNTTPQEAVDALGAALRGESEPIRRYGILLDDATLKAEALALGISDGKTTLTQQQRVLAAQSAILKQTSDAQGDFARTSDGLANQQRILKAELENVGTELGVVLLPVAQTVVAFIRDEFVPRVQKLVDGFKALSPEMQNMVLIGGGLAAALGPALLVLGPMVSAFGGLLKFLAPVVSGLGAGGLAGALSALAAPAAIIVAAIAGIVAILVALWRESEAFRNGVVALWDAVRQAVGQAVDFIKTKFDENKEGLDALRGAFQFLGDMIAQYVIPAVQTYLVTAFDVLAKVLGFVIDVMGDLITTGRTVAVESLRTAAFMVRAYSQAVDSVLSVVGNLINGLASAFGGLLPFLNDAAGRFNDWRNSTVTNVNGVAVALDDMAAKLEAATQPRVVDIGVRTFELPGGGIVPPGFQVPSQAPTQTVPMVTPTTGTTAAPKKTPWEQFVEDMREGRERALARARLIGRGIPEQLADAIVGREGFQRITARLLAGGREVLSRFVNLWLESADGRASIKSAVDAIVQRAQEGIDKLKEKTREFGTVQGDFLRTFLQFGRVSAVQIPEGLDMTAGAITAGLSERLSMTREFFRALKQLQRLDLRAPTLLDILRLGPEQGLPYAQAILAGGQIAIDEINQLSAAFAAPSAAGGLANLGAELVTGTTRADLIAGQQFQVQAGAVQITVNGEVTATVRKQITDAVTDAFSQVGREARTRGRAGVR